ELGKLTQTVGGRSKIVSDPPDIVPIDELTKKAPNLEARLRDVFRSYRRTLPADRRKLTDEYTFGDLAHKVVGVGSVGLQCWVLLLAGRDARVPLFLQLKEAQASVLEPYLGASDFANGGQRVVEGQRMSQAASDIFLGWVTADELN